MEDDDATLTPTLPRASHVWESGYAHEWDAVEENAQGLSLKPTTAEDWSGEFAKKKRRLELEQGSIRRWMLRTVLIVVDASKASGSDLDYKPSRLVVGCDHLKRFANNFFDENPLSSVGIACTREGRAEKLCDFSRSPTQADHALSVLQDYGAARGHASLQNSLELAWSMFQNIPQYGSREVVILASALSVVDPGDVFSTMKKLREAKIRCSVVHLSGLMEIYRRVAEQTEGVFAVALSQRHLQELLAAHLTPPPSARADEKAQGGMCYMVRMGFPSQRIEDSSNSNITAQPAYCADTKQVQYAPFYCPRCKAAASTIPSTCRACHLPLISSSHLARTYHHLAPVQVFIEIPPKSLSATHCSTCSFETTRLSQCPKCGNVFCQACDDMIHDSLFVCPGCCN